MDRKELFLLNKEERCVLNECIFLSVLQSIEVTFQMGEQTMVGDDLIVTSLVKNVSSEERTVTVTMTARTTTYWDRSISDENLAKENFADVTIKPAESKERCMQVPALG